MKTTTRKDTLTITALLILLVTLVVIGPLAVIWSLNTLFPILAIPFGFYQWAAVMLLNSIVFGKAYFTKKG